jgi:hypothetical protein
MKHNLQRDITKSYAMEAALLNKLQGTLPQDASGYFNSDAGGTGTLEDASQWYDWLAGLLNTLYLDATCGEYFGTCVSRRRAPQFTWHSACNPQVLGIYIYL